jgi:two-component system sporulation sensor kinase A
MDLLSEILKNRGPNMVLSNLIKQGNVSFESLFNYMEDMFFTIQVEGDDVYRCVEINQAYKNNTGLNEDAILNKRVEDIVSHDEAMIAIERYRNAIHSKKSLTYEEQATLNGIQKTYETTIIPVLENDSTCNFIIGISRDITSRKIHEDKTLQTKLEFQKVIHHQQGLIFSITKKDKDFFYTLCDGQILKKIHLPSEQIVGRRPQDIMPPELANKIILRYEQAWSHQEKVVFEEVTPNGYVWLTVINPVVENGKTVTLIGSSVDVTEKRKTEEALIKTEKLSLLGELSAGIGHEIRNPLTTIKGFIKIMKENNQNLKREYLDVVESEIESIDRIAGELMMLAKPQVHQSVLLDIVSLIKDLIFLMETHAFQQGVQLKLHTSVQSVKMKGDRSQLKQVLFNLVKNAIESMEDKKKGTVHIFCELKGSEITIKVADEGCGIKKEKLDSLGEPFYTTKSKGNGLGLMITQRIIKNHNGTLDCKSEIGKGTIFTISLPL